VIYTFSYILIIIVTTIGICMTKPNLDDGNNFKAVETVAVVSRGTALVGAGIIGISCIIGLTSGHVPSAAFVGIAISGVSTLFMHVAEDILEAKGCQRPPSGTTKPPARLPRPDDPIS
jgi:hypothetical protein